MEPRLLTLKPPLAGIESQRIHRLNALPFNTAGRYVLYWMQINRRAQSNPALAHAIDIANQLQKPLVVYEGLRCDYPQANDRIHTFILEGVKERHDALKALGCRPVLFVQQAPDQHRDTVERLSAEACAVITDGYPTFLIPGHNRRLARFARCTALAVDASTLLPPQLFPKQEWAARTLRPRYHRALPDALRPVHAPVVAHPDLDLALPIDWQTDPSTPVARLVAACQIDHSVPPSTLFRGGTEAAHSHLRTFITRRLAGYPDGRNDPGTRGTSELSPYLHFGMISPVEVALAALESSAPEASIAAFLEELLVRRELAFNYCTFNPHFSSLKGLPDWCQKTLAEHDGDARPWQWTCAQIEAAATEDPVFNMAQKELLITGKIHGYIRMLWGKKILEYAPSHQEALRIMIYLHDKYALDGRDPNTYTGIQWCLGLHDRPWGPARPVLGTIRYMSSDATRRKTNLDAYRKWLDYAAAVRRPVTEDGK